MENLSNDCETAQAVQNFLNLNRKEKESNQIVRPQRLIERLREMSSRLPKPNFIYLVPITSGAALAVWSNTQDTRFFMAGAVGTTLTLAGTLVISAISDLRKYFDF